MFLSLFCWCRRHVNIPEHRWRRLARHVSRHTFLTYLAEQVAKNLLNNKPSGMTIEELCDQVLKCPSDDLQYRAERFIEKFYFNYPFYNEEFFAVVSDFRRLIHQHLSRMKSSN